jgi:hypothetical protein
MTKGEILAKYKNLSAKEQYAFNQWLLGNAVVGSFFGLVLVASAAAGSRTEQIASAPLPPSAPSISIQELHGLARLENLSLMQIQDLTFVFVAPDEPEAGSAILAQADRDKR